MKKLFFTGLLIFISLTIYPQCWKTVSRTIHHTIAIRNDGSLWAVGYNSIGELGLGQSINAVDTFTQVGTDMNWKTVCAASGFTIALKENNTLWAWGENGYGTLGDGTIVRKYIPEQIGTDSNWETISSSQYHTMAIKKNGTLWSWGMCSNGVGNTMYESYNIPTQIGTDTNWLQVSTGSCFTIALKKDHTLWGWGENYYGQVGDGTGWFVVTPKKIGVDTNWSTIAAGYYHSLAIKTDGSLWTWGEGAFGKLGNGTTMNKLIPTKIGVANNWRSVSGSTFHSLALKNDGTLWACGRNAYGENGFGTRIESDSFVKVGIDTNWKYITASSGVSNCLKTNNTLWACGDGYFGSAQNSFSDTLIFINSFFVNNWIGGVSNLWEDPENWSCKCIPNEYSNVLIKQGAVYLNSNVDVNSLKLNPSAKFTINSGNFLKILH